MNSDEAVNVAEDKSSSPAYNGKDAARGTSSDVERDVHGEVETVETTKRGLKARHAQMIALGGTIGKAKVFKSPSIENLTVILEQEPVSSSVAAAPSPKAAPSSSYLPTCFSQSLFSSSSQLSPK